MGEPKWALDFGGEPLLCRVAKRIAEVVDEVVLVAAPAGIEPDLDPLLAVHDRLRADLRQRAGKHAQDVLLTRDLAPYLGPVSGLAGGLGVASGAVAFAASCDAPFLEPRLAERLLELAETSPELDAVVPRSNDRLEPLCAVYRVATMAGAFAAQLAAGELRPTGRFVERKVRFVAAEELRALDPELLSFENLNSPQEYAAALRRLRGGSG
jgi:molybdopterin-guanine dinucleotide biosynthesis protein A